MSAFDELLKGCATGVRCVVRTARAGRSGPAWSEPREVALYLQRDGAGRLCVVALQDEELAEFDPRHNDEGDQLLLSEDYYLEVQRVLR